MKILLIDDHSLFRDGMHLVLAAMDDNVQIFNAASYEDALPLMLENPDMDLILLDLTLPGLSDVAALSAIRNEAPSVPVVVVSGNDDGSKVQQMLHMGAQGYIPKSTSSGLLMRALKLVLSGGIYIPPEILSHYESESEESESESTELYKRRETNSSDSRLTLTPRQLEVLQKMACGHSNKEISVQLKMAEATVRAHVAAIFKTLNATNRTQAAHIAIKNGWVAVEPEV